MSILEQLRKLDEQRAALLDNAKKEALAKAEAAVSDLNSLGFDYRLSEGSGKAKKTASVRQIDPNKPCAVCNFATTPNHDSRRHRGQGDSKKAFTAKELAEMGMAKK